MTAPANANAIRLPRVATHHDVVDTFESFHEAMRDVAAWALTIIDDGGNANARDARWLRAFLKGPLAWHIADEENILVPWLALRHSDWLDTCLAHASDRWAGIIEAAEQLPAVIEPLCAGNPVPVMRFVGGVPVVDADDKPLGMISRADLVALYVHHRGSLPVLDSFDAFDANGAASAAPPTRARDVMSRVLFTLREHESIARAAFRFAAEDVQRAPVVDAQGKVVGVLTAYDVVRGIAAT